ncbi:MAG: DoxX family protein [Pseudonocardia sp.]
MNIVVWILQIVLALAFLASGGMKLARPRPALVASGMGFAEDFSDGAVKGIGALEVLGAIGLILPALTGIAPILTPIAALGLALVMVGAVVVDVRRKDQFVPALVLGVLALAVAILRFGPYAL